MTQFALKMSLKREKKGFNSFVIQVNKKTNKFNEKRQAKFI